MSGEIKSSWTYRAAILISAFYGPIYISIYYFLWRAVYGATPSGIINGMTFSSIITYLAIANVVQGMLYSYIDWDIAETVRSGNLVLLLCRPMGFMSIYAARWVGANALNLAMVTIPNIIFICIFIPMEVNFTAQTLLFIPSIILGMVIAFAFDFIVGTIAFYTESIYGITATKSVLMTFFSGQLIPIAMFPGVLREIAMLLPFQAVVNTPVSILTDSAMGLGDALRMMLIQLLWAAALVMFGSLFFKRSVRRVTVNGG